MAKKRTTAQRRAAAKEAWRLRRLRAAEAPSSASKLPAVNMDIGWVKQPPIDFGIAPGGVDTTTIGATKEGLDYFVTVTHNGSLFRHRVSALALRKLGLDCLTLVG